MKRLHFNIILVWLVLLVLLVVLCSSVYADVDYFTERMNFPPGSSRSHKQTLTNNGNTTIVVNATVPSGFSASASDCSQPTASLFSCTLSPSSSKYFTITSPSNCTEGTIYKSQLTSNSSFSEEFTFVCIPDNKITDCKIEYGHGDANYLPNDQLYISNETASIFNLVRVWNIGHYLTPDEAAENATITCQYENYPVRTYGRVEIDYGTSYVNGTFFWSLIESGYWFRIGVVSQDVSGKSIGNYYNKTCSNLTYQYDHHQVVAAPSLCNLEIRDTAPFTTTITSHPYVSGKALLTIINNEKYDTYDLSFDKLLNNEEHTETYRQLNSGNSVSYVIDQSNNCSINLFFIPSWYINSWHPRYYTQTLNCSFGLNNPPILSTIGSQTAYVNNTFTFDVNATDYDNDNLTFYDNTSLFDIDNLTGLINFTPNASMIGNYSINISVFDIYNASDYEVFNLEIKLIPPLCGDNNLDIGEVCDDGNNNDCDGCKGDCSRLDNVCGDSIVECGEQCDSGNLNSQTCVSLGYSSGSLSCTLNCTFNTSACVTAPSPPPSDGGGGGRRPEPEPEPEPVPIEEVKDMELRIISYPDDLIITDEEFVVVAEVQNTGSVILEDIILEVDNNQGWYSESEYLGNFDPGERKRVNIRFENEICSSESFVIKSGLKVELTAKEKEIEDYEEAFIDVGIPELSVFTDSNWYSEGDVMRLCIIYNNIGKDSKEQLEFEINFVYEEEEPYIIDYLSPYSVDKDKILIVTRDYVLNDIPVTTDYIIDVALFGRGDLFSEKYLITETSTEVFLNGITEDEILQEENTSYEFRYKDEMRRVHINYFDENFVDITLYSPPENFRIKLLETINIDLDEDDVDDISLTYLGVKDDKADIRIKILPKVPKQVPIKATESYEIGLEEITPIFEKPGAVTKITFWDRFKSFVVIGLFRLMFGVILIIGIAIIVELIFYFFPESKEFVVKTKNDFVKFLKTKTKDMTLKIKIRLAKFLKPKIDKFLNTKSIKKEIKR
ncbi:hypothetical protein KY342_05835 [Candidatus Woesearchaeota archaeon]|nr:hypothetical protein [Candidatus Woesearchaeota archaeon]